jgi:hypothetical protein
MKVKKKKKRYHNIKEQFNHRITTRRENIKIKLGRKERENRKTTEEPNEMARYGGTHL